jgi:hypothetical protein
MKSVNYKGYTISPNNTGFVSFDFYIDGGETIKGHGKSIEDCKEQIDELLNE